MALGLGVGLEGGEPTAVYLEICNTGALAAEWRLMTRDESEVDMENWVEIGEPDDEVTAHQRFVVENGIVEITPRLGTLQPGERQPLRVLYKHSHAGQHWLTALLHVKDGRDVRLGWAGGRSGPSFGAWTYPRRTRAWRRTRSRRSASATSSPRSRPSSSGTPPERRWSGAWTSTRVERCETPTGDSTS